MSHHPWPFKTRVTHARPVLVVSEDEPQNDALYEPYEAVYEPASDADVSQPLGETR